MKYVVVIAVVLFGLWLWRKLGQSRQRDEPPAAPPSADHARKDEATPQDMVRCPVCALHLPKADAVVGRTALYCSREHRAQMET